MSYARECTVRPVAQSGSDAQIIFARRPGPGRPGRPLSMLYTEQCPTTTLHPNPNPPMNLCLLEPPPHCHACHTALSVQSRALLVGQHEGRRPAHVRAALRHRMRAEGPLAGRALLALLDDDGQGQAVAWAVGQCRSGRPLQMQWCVQTRAYSRCSLKPLVVRHGGSRTSL